MATLPEQVKKAIGEPQFWTLATVNPDGSPQASIVWVDERDGNIKICGEMIAHVFRARHRRYHDPGHRDTAELADLSYIRLDVGQILVSAQSAAG